MRKANFAAVNALSLQRGDRAGSSKIRSLALIASFALAGFGAGVSHAQGSDARVADTEPLPIKADLPGRDIFERQCAPCHAAGPGDDGTPMLPGTMALARKYSGHRYGALELRTDLTVEVLRHFLRNGIGAMPMFRKAELSDADIEAIAEYLKATAEANLSR